MFFLHCALESAAFQGPGSMWRLQFLLFSFVSLPPPTPHRGSSALPSFSITTVVSALRSACLSSVCLLFFVLGDVRVCVCVCDSPVPWWWRAVLLCKLIWPPTAGHLFLVFGHGQSHYRHASERGPFADTFRFSWMTPRSRIVGSRDGCTFNRIRNGGPLSAGAAGLRRGACVVVPALSCASPVTRR